jgi:hypothetical protein
MQMTCPHCQEVLTLKQAIEILNGSGYTQMALVKTAEGTVSAIDAGSVNPNTVEILA